MLTTWLVADWLQINTIKHWWSAQQKTTVHAPDYNIKYGIGSKKHQLTLPLFRTTLCLLSLVLFSVLAVGLGSGGLVVLVFSSLV